MSERRLSRRALLGASAATLASAAGCLAIGGGGGPDRPTATPTSDRGPGSLRFGRGFSENGVQARPSNAVVQASVLHETADGALDVLAPTDRQVLFVALLTAGSPGIDLPRPDDLLVSFDGGSVRGQTALGSVSGDRLRPDDHDAPYDVSDERAVTEVRGWVAFPLPATGSFDGATLDLEPSEPGRPAATWDLPGATRAALSTPLGSPRVTSLSVPDAVDGDQIPVSLAVQNVGDGVGRLRLGLNVDGRAARAVRLPVAAGATETWEGEVPAGADDESTLEVRTAHERLERTVGAGG